MKPSSSRLYHAREFAELAGVTLRTLDHCDRLGLLEPSCRSDAGYRLYSQRDLAQLEQVVVLKFLGLPLNSIRKLLKSEPGSLREVLECQHKVLADRRLELNRAIAAIPAARTTLDANHEPDSTLITQIIRRVRNRERYGLDGKVLQRRSKSQSRRAEETLVPGIRGARDAGVERAIPRP